MEEPETEGDGSRGTERTAGDAVTWPFMVGRYGIYILVVLERSIPGLKSDRPRTCPPRVDELRD